MSALSVSSLGSTALNSYSSLYQLGSDTQSKSISSITDLADKAEISGDAFAKYELMKMLDTFSFIYSDTSKSGTKSLFDIGQDLAEDIADYTDLLGEIFQAAGIDTSTQELVLKPDFAGSVDVVNDHPDAATVTSLYDNNPTLTARMAVIAAEESLLNAAATNPEFKAAYEQDARAAVQDYIGVLTENLFNYKMVISDGEISSSFE